MEKTSTNITAALAAVYIWCPLLWPELPHVLRVFYCADSDPAEVYATVRTEDISYGPIIIKDRKKTSKTEGTAALLCLYQDSLLQPETEASCYSGYEDEKIFGIIKNETTINDFKTLPIFDATYNL